MSYGESVAVGDQNDGVVVDEDGRVTGYNVKAGKNTKRQFFPVENCLLIYDPDRLSSYRGFSPMRRGANDLRDVLDVKRFEKIATKVGSAIAAVIESDGPLEDDLWGGPSTNGDNEGTEEGDGEQTATEKKISMAELLGGDIFALEKGQKLNQLKNERPGQNTLNFMDYLTSCFVSGLNIPPAFFHDEKLTGPNIRAVIGKAQRTFDSNKAIMSAFVEWVWIRVIGWAIAHGELPELPGWWRISFQYPAKCTIDIGDQMKNDRDAVLSAQMSRQELADNLGLDYPQRQKRIFAEDQSIVRECKRIAAEEGIDVNILLERHLGSKGGSSKDQPQDTSKEQTTGKA